MILKAMKFIGFGVALITIDVVILSMMHISKDPNSVLAGLVSLLVLKDILRKEATP